MVQSATIHGVAVAVGEIGLLIRGPSGAGKSSLAAAMIADWPFGTVRLVADDRVMLSRHQQRLVARPHPAITGRIELRGFGIQTVPSIDAIVLRGCVDLMAGQPDRLPAEEQRHLMMLDLSLPYLRLSQNQTAFSAIVTLWPYFRDQMLEV